MICDCWGPFFFDIFKTVYNLSPTTGPDPSRQKTEHSKAWLLSISPQKSKMAEGEGGRCSQLSMVSDVEAIDFEDEVEDDNTWKEIFTDPAVNFYSCGQSGQHETETNQVAISEKEEEKTGLAGPRRMELNDHKAGMEGLDKERINKIIFEASKGSRFYENELKKEAQVSLRIEKQTAQLLSVTEEQRQEALKQVDVLIQELEAARDLRRTIVHIDMDAFYAAVEIRENPTLREKPMAVGDTGMLSTSNYQARKYGVRAAMPGFIGKKLCPELIIVPPHHDKYQEISHEVREILAEYDPNFVPMSLDEAYLDLTEYLAEHQKNVSKQTFAIIKKLNTLEKASNSVVNNSSDTEVETVEFGNYVEDVVREIRFKIEQKTQLTASAGIAPNTMLAKVTSDRNKPNGQFYLKPERDTVLDFVHSLPIRKISGIGRVSEQMLRALGIVTCKDLYAKRELLYLLHSQTSCRFLLSVSLGLGVTRLEGGGPRKSLGTETTFSEINQPSELYNVCEELCQAVVKTLKSEGLKGRTVTMKLKTVKFEVKTRSLSLANHVSSFEQISSAAKELLRHEIKACQPEPLRLRLMGVRLSNFQACIMSDQNRETKQDTITGFLSRSKHKSKHPSVSTQYGLEDSGSSDGKVLQPSSASCVGSHVVDHSALGLHPENGPVSNKSLSGHSSGCLQSNLTPLASHCEQDTQEQVSTMEYVGQSASSTPLVCPVCDEEQSVNGAGYLREFNKHVDLCLSKAAIREMLSKDKTSGADRGCTDSQVSCGKRRRQDLHGSSKKITLHKFWAK